MECNVDSADKAARPVKFGLIMDQIHDTRGDMIRRRCRRWVRQSVPYAAWMVAVALALFLLGPQADGQTIMSTGVNRVAITVGSKVVRLHLTNPLRFGFSISTDSIINPTPGGSNTLWDSTHDVIRPALYNFLGSDFTGAVYRFPGGANSYDWYRMIGSYASRAANQEFKDYNQKYTAYFGVPEFMKFVNQAHGGSPIIILNIVEKDGVALTDATWPADVRNLVGFLEYLNAPSNQDWDGDGVMQGAKRADDGHPAPYNVYRFELGNELDMPGGLTKEVYIARCRDVIKAFNQHPIGAHPYQFMAFGSTLIMGHSSWQEWDQYVVSKLGRQISSIVAHTYFDGYSIPWNMANNQTLANDIDLWTLRAGFSSKPNIAVTEEGRWPDDLDKVATWPSTVGLSAAVSNVDMIISQEQQPTISMSLNYGIANWTPWGLFMPSNANGYIDPGPFSPEPLAFALKLVNRAMRNVDVLETSITAPHNAGYGDIHHAPFCLYDVRATGYRNSRGQYGVLAVNRSTSGYPLTLTLPGVTTGTTVLSLRLDQVNGSAPGIVTKNIRAPMVKGTIALWLPPFGIYSFTTIKPPGAAEAALSK